MRTSDIEQLKKDLDRYIGLKGNNLDLIDDAIAMGGSSYRAEESLKTLAYNLKKEGEALAANMVLEVLNG